MSTPALFPEGVFARYLTVGGATVDLIARSSTVTGESFETRGACTGCPAAEIFTHYLTVCAETPPYDRDVHDPDTANEAARDWAQSHAETCRAVPRPEVTA